ncbi:MAG: hypothetical protein QOK44_216, partial [Betaproteobacteria bacterium]|nr:hypothetical protein [Betaproteobacteria bacterium]
RTMREPERTSRFSRAALYVENGCCYIECAGGGVLRVIESDVDGEPVAPVALAATFGIDSVLQLQPEGVEEGTT